MAFSSLRGWRFFLPDSHSSRLNAFVMIENTGGGLGLVGVAHTVSMPLASGIIKNGIGNGLVFIAFRTSIVVIPDINVIDS